MSFKEGGVINSTIRTLSVSEQKEAAKAFYERWKDRGREKQEDQKFWNELLHDVLGVENVSDFIDYQYDVRFENSVKNADGYIAKTKILIEQKSKNVNLAKAEQQSDGAWLRPDQQARRYANNMPRDDRPRYIIVSNFQEIWIYDENRPHSDPEKIAVKDLPKEYYRLQFIVDTGNAHIKKEMELSIKAGEIVGEIYNALRERYVEPDNLESLKSLNKLCVRLVFCLYAEDAGLFGRKNAFHDYLAHFEARDCRNAIKDLFNVLNQKEEDRDKYLQDDLAAFPYVNGGLFDGEDIEIPQFTEEIRSLILAKASDDFNWSEISPTIFGAVFESTLNPETRRKGGMHYTSIENIHKVIDPLFYDELCDEFEAIKSIKTASTRNQKLEAFRDKLADLTFLDPACGSGNFLTETYLSLRRLENEAIETMQNGQSTLGFMNPIKVHIDQFYGIEINDFAVTVAKTALWIAESQMMQKTEQIMHQSLDFLPLKTYTHIVEGNALRVDWNEIIPSNKLNYIMGNPPFVYKMTDEQRWDRVNIFGDKGGELDYVACWYKKAADYIANHKVYCAFVSTNSICQGLQVYPLWKPLFDSGITINFAHTTFRWDSEANLMAHVHVIIVGFSRDEERQKYLFSAKGKKAVKNINGYLIESDNIFIERRSRPLFDVPIVIKGYQPTDNGYLIMSNEQKEQLLLNYPESISLVRPFITAKEYIHGVKRWCLWLVGVSPNLINRIPEIKNRVQLCREWRYAQVKTGDAYKLRDIPTQMRPCSKYKGGDYIVLPLHTGESRKYIPFGFLDDYCIPGNSVSIIPNANLYHFGILESNVHMAWMRVVCGRLESRYRYSSDIVYNNFVWPNVTDAQKKRIEQTAKAILDARDKHPDSSLADLYDDTCMPPELRRAHLLNDKAVMEAYGFLGKVFSESECVGELMKKYKELSDDQSKK